ncbi:Heavy-metal-associated domain protein [compost metagenome]
MTNPSTPTTLAFRVEGMTCQSCVRRVDGILNAHFEGLTHQVDLAAKTLTVTGDDQDVTGEAIAQALHDGGYPATRL